MVKPLTPQPPKFRLRNSWTRSHRRALMTEESGLALWSNQSLSSGAVFPTLLLWQQNAAAGAPRPAPSRHQDCAPIASKHGCWTGDGGSKHGKALWSPRGLLVTASQRGCRLSLRDAGTCARVAPPPSGARDSWERQSYRDSHMGRHWGVWVQAGSFRRLHPPPCFHQKLRTSPRP